ncbi:MAG: PilZ domain-containing protein [Candidatus Electrothrix sp. YB6]
MQNMNRRRFARISLHWAAHLDFGVKEYKRFVANVSLSGFYVEGDFQQNSKDLCVVKLTPSGLLNTEEAVRAVGTVTRLSENGMAVEFLSMKLDSFFFLETTLLYRAVDPAALGREFIWNNILEFEGDTVFFKPYSLKRWNIKQLSNFFLKKK